MSAERFWALFRQAMRASAMGFGGDPFGRIGVRKLPPKCIGCGRENPHPWWFCTQKGEVRCGDCAAGHEHACVPVWPGQVHQERHA